MKTIVKFKKKTTHQNASLRTVLTRSAFHCYFGSLKRFTLPLMNCKIKLINLFFKFCSGQNNIHSCPSDISRSDVATVSKGGLLSRSPEPYERIRLRFLFYFSISMKKNAFSWKWHHWLEPFQLDCMKVEEKEQKKTSASLAQTDVRHDVLFCPNKHNLLTYQIIILIAAPFWTMFE